MEDTLRHLDKYRQKYKKAQEKAAELNRKVDEIGEDKADFYLLQDLQSGPLRRADLPGSYGEDRRRLLCRG